MEVSPLPSQPAQVHLQHQYHHPRILSPSLGNHQRTSTSDSSNSSSSHSHSSKQSLEASHNTAHKSFDQSFFSKLASYGSSKDATSTSRSRTRSAEVPLSNKDVNSSYSNNNHPSSSSSSTLFDKASTAVLPPPLKKPYGLLRTSSARPVLLSTQSSSSLINNNPSDPNNPFQVSPRPSAFLERAHSDNTLSFGGTFPKTTREGGGRKPSNLGREISTARPSLLACGPSNSQGRKISGR